MAYAGPARPRSGYRNSSADRPQPGQRHAIGSEVDEDVAGITEPSGRPFTRSIAWNGAGLFGAGIAVGVMIGAGAALLFAPQSGSETRYDIARGTRDLSYRATDAWEDLRDELRGAASRGTKRLRRGVRRGRSLTDDMVDTVRRRS